MKQKPLNAFTPNRISELDALRGFAALLVLAFHYGCLGAKISAFRFGVTGVDLFFMISGFVILLTVEKSDSPQKFLTNRFSRLYPVYWVCVILTSITILINNPATGGFLWRFVANLTMIQRLLQQRDIDDPYWTLLVELFFYLYILLLLCFKQIKNIEIISLLILAVNFIYGLYAFLQIKASGEYAFQNFVPIVSHFPLFMAGMLFYKIRNEGPNTSRYLTLLFCFICQLLLFKSGGRSRSYVYQLPYSLMLTAYFLLFYLFVNGKLKFIVNKVTLFFGGISYVLYLLHQYIGLHFMIPFFSGFMNTACAYSVTLILIIILSALINRYIELPMMRLIRHRKLNQVPAIDLLAREADK